MIAANQGRTFLRLLAEFRPHLRTDRNLPARLQQRLAKEKRFGSRDRRLYRELLYTAIRHLPWIETLLARSEEDALRAVVWLAVDDTSTRPLKQGLPADWPPLPSTIAARAAHLGVTEPLLPEWFRPHCPAAFESPEIDVLNTRAPLWLRLQTDDTRGVFEEFTFRQWTWKPATILPNAIEVLTQADLTKTDAYERGEFEVQDLGSQLLLEAVGPAPGSRWLDACAGAGGKTLQLARLVGPSGHVDAIDPRSTALAELKLRANRARLSQITVRQHPPAPDALYDGVLVDAPCSGTGTWRRFPQLKWSTTETDITTSAQRQREILARYASHVRPGGLLVYATCSLSHVENDDIVTEFLAAHPEFEPTPFAKTFGASASRTGLTILPSLHNTDGYFVAALRRK
ncbi:MAG: RsmB/NOP family class I SAM-dependent RNA methyltransferase [Verrucomicrobia bacterium]|nr:RsmB/NOP family class I SAM-dependent RNA methyltransferase [Verrucomicrobiota bacterium]